MNAGGEETVGRVDALTPAVLDASHERYRRWLDRKPGRCPARRLRLVHRVPASRLGAVVADGRLLSARQVEASNTFLFDRKVGLDSYVFCSLGHLALWDSLGLGATLILSEARSAELLARPTSRATVHDFADVLTVHRAKRPDIEFEREPFRKGFADYSRLVVPAAAIVGLVHDYVARRHGGDWTDYQDFVFRCHQGRGFDHLAEEVHGFVAAEGTYPLVPEVLIHDTEPVTIGLTGDIVLGDDADAECVDFPGWRLHHLPPPSETVDQPRALTLFRAVASLATLPGA